MTKKPQTNKYASDFTSEGVDAGQMLEDFGFFESAFQAGQWEATKKKLRELLEEKSKAPDIAVRTAVSLCAPGVAKKRFRADNLGQTPTTAGKVGGNYECIDHENGFFSILNIEIFAEVPPGAKRNKERIGEDWMDKAIEKNRLRRREGFMPPVHIWHSDETAVKPTYAGKFALIKRGTIVYEGREMPAIFANITDIPADVFKRIQAGTLPYRSVEVHDWDNPEIDSLALMDTDVPFFRMAMTTVGSVRKQRGPLPIGLKNTVRTPMHWFAERFDEDQGIEGAAICFRFEDRTRGANMATSISTVKAGETSKSALVQKPKGAGPQGNTEGLTKQESGTGGDMGPSSGTATEDQESITGLDDGDSGPKTYGNSSVDKNSAPGGTEDEQVNMDDGMGGAPPAGGDPMSAIMSILQAIASKLGVGGGAAPASAPSAPPPSPSADLTPVAGMRADNNGARLQAAQIEKILLRTVAPLQAKLAAQEKINQAHAFRSKINGMVNAAKANLTGWTIDAEIEKTLFSAAKIGQEYLDEVVGLIQKTQPVDPMDSPEAFEASLAESPEGGEVAKFMAENPGPKNSEYVRLQSREHAEWVAKTGSGITFADWLKANKYAETIHLTAKKPNGQPMGMVR